MARESPRPRHPAVADLASKRGLQRVRGSAPRSSCLLAVVVVGAAALVWSRTIADDGDDVIHLDEPGEYVDPAMSNPPNDGDRLPDVELTTVDGSPTALRRRRPSDGRQPLVLDVPTVRPRADVLRRRRGRPRRRHPVRRRQPARRRRRHAALRRRARRRLRAAHRSRRQARRCAAHRAVSRDVVRRRRRRDRRSDRSAQRGRPPPATSPSCWRDRGDRLQRPRAGLPARHGRVDQPVRVRPAADLPAVLPRRAGGRAGGRPAGVGAPSAGRRLGRVGRFRRRVPRRRYRHRDDRLVAAEQRQVRHRRHRRRPS